jgi:predicted phosphodiesterase
MKLLILSDLHLEFDQFLIPEMEDEKDIVVILAGDIGIAKKPHTYLRFIDDTANRFHSVLWVLGNHEHYKGNFPTSHAKIFMQTVDYDNVFVLEKETHVIDDVAFVCATLWTDMDNNNPIVTYTAGLQMNDYRHIRTGPDSEPWRQKLRPIDTIADHLRAKEFIFDEIEKQKDDGKTVVVVTHHLPSFMSIHEMYKGSTLDGAYASELGEYIVMAEPKLWIHGHTHNSFDYTIGDTRIVCNPRGYLPKDPNLDFNATKVIEI